jgi:hypothetical protein
MSLPSYGGTESPHGVQSEASLGERYYFKR